MTAAEVQGPRARRGGGPTDPSHDEDLRRGILRTAITRPVAALLAAPFLLGIAALPASQAVLEKIKGDESVLPDLWKGAPTRESLKQLEEDLGNASYAREAVRPVVQYALTRFGGFGNVKAVLGRKPGWLFYQPGVAAVGGPGFLDADILAARRKASLDEGDGALFPDPRPAILQLHRYLAARGIALVLFPVPDKAGLQPAELHGRFPAPGATAPPGENVDYRRLVAELEQQGVAVFDPTPRAIEGGALPRFQEQDTHWTPAWMEEVAAQLAAFLTSDRHLLGPPAQPRAWKASSEIVSRVGDIVDMLKLPQESPALAPLYTPRAVVIHPIADAAGAPFAPEPTADLLLLGDSFTNVYSLGQMGWGENAGLAPQLARALGRNVDVIAQNDAGAHATRQLLSNALAGGEDRLAGKKVVVWELASRELAVGNWKLAPWPAVTTGAKAGAGGTQ
jgi:alginate O-acetyltransferase complex protein AlgJ